MQCEVAYVRADLAAATPQTKDCIWDDCDQEAIYCEGHALEFVDPLGKLAAAPPPAVAQEREQQPPAELAEAIAWANGKIEQMAQWPVLKSESEHLQTLIAAAQSSLPDKRDAATPAAVVQEEPDYSQTVYAHCMGCKGDCRGLAINPSMFAAPAAVAQEEPFLLVHCIGFVNGCHCGACMGPETVAPSRVW